MEKERWGKTLRPASLGCVATPAPENVSPKEWKISYLITAEHDLGMPDAFQKSIVKGARDAGVDIETTEMVSGHFVQISHAKKVAEWVSGVSV